MVAFLGAADALVLAVAQVEKETSDLEGCGERMKNDDVQ